MTKRVSSNLARLMGERRLRVSDAMRGTGLSRNAIKGLYNNTARRVDLETVALLCEFLDCEIQDLLELEDVTD